MRTWLGTVLSVIAVGGLLIAYGLLSPRTSATGPAWNRVSVAGDSGGDAYQLARPMSGRERAEVGDATAMPQFRLRCEPGQRAVIRQMAGAAEAECVDPSSSVDRYGSMRTPVAYRYPAPRRATPVRVERSSSRDWKRTALVIGGTTAASAGLGAIFAGKKGALIGAAIGGGASSLYEARQR